MPPEFVKIHCPSCDKRLKVPSAKYKPSKKVVCPKCKIPFTTPEVGSEPAPIQAEIVEAEFSLATTPSAQNSRSTKSGDSYWQKPNSNADGPASHSTKQKKRKRHDGPVELTETEERLKQGGIGMVIFGVGASVLPFLGLQWRRMRLDGTSSSVSGLVIGLIGAGLFAYAMRNHRKEGWGLAAGMAAIVFSASVTGYIFQSMNPPPENPSQQNTELRNPFDSKHSNFDKLKRKPTRISR